jgi:PEGA domain
MRVACSLILSATLAFPTALLPTTRISQDKDATTPQEQQAAPPVVKQPLAFGLEEGTPIKLRISRTISSADAQLNETVDFEVLEEVKVHDLVVVPRGGTAWGTVTEAQSKRRMGRGGKLNINIDNVRLVDGEKVALRAVKDVKGGGHQGAITGAIVATSIIFFPAAPLFLLVHGKDITIPKGTEITAYVNADTPLVADKFAPKIENAPSQAMASETHSPKGADSALSSVEVNSTPDAAEITVDDKYRGSTPAILKLSTGDHRVKLEKAGFRSWEKTLTLSGGENTKISATLDKE